ncbi:MAG: hypothetical protein M1827_002459 [Pycnora praestabilis]|nr:MAG: hypothetical protein M1827_002459 [Pycnora praestabilis]
MEPFRKLRLGDPEEQQEQRAEAPQSKNISQPQQPPAQPKSAGSNSPWKFPRSPSFMNVLGAHLRNKNSDRNDKPQENIPPIPRPRKEREDFRSSSNSSGTQEIPLLDMLNEGRYDGNPQGLVTAARPTSGSSGTRSQVLPGFPTSTGLSNLTDSHTNFVTAPRRAPVPEFQQRYERRPQMATDDNENDAYNVFQHRLASETAANMHRAKMDLYRKELADAEKEDRDEEAKIRDVEKEMAEVDGIRVKLSKERSDLDEKRKESLRRQQLAKRRVLELRRTIVENECKGAAFRSRTYRS